MSIVNFFQSWIILVRHLFLRVLHTTLGSQKGFPDVDTCVTWHKWLVMWKFQNLLHVFLIRIGFTPLNKRFCYDLNSTYVWIFFWQTIWNCRAYAEVVLYKTVVIFLKVHLQINESAMFISLSKNRSKLLTNSFTTWLVCNVVLTVNNPCLVLHLRLHWVSLCKVFIYLYWLICTSSASNIMIVYETYLSWRWTECREKLFICQKIILSHTKR